MRLLWILVLASFSYTVAYYPVFLAAKAAARIYEMQEPQYGQPS